MHNLIMKNLFSLLLIIIIHFGCKNTDYIHEEFESPTVEIISIKVLSKNTCEIELKVNLGVGAVFKEAYVILNDITMPDDIIIKHTFELTIEKEQIHKFEIRVDEEFHDYRIKAVLVSQKNEYTSEPQIISFAKQLDQSGISVGLLLSPTDYLYFDETTNVALNVKKGEHFSIIIEYSKMPENKKTEVKLNGSIPMEMSMSWEWGTNTSNSGWVYLPENISSGEYTVHVFINDIEYILDHKIRVLPGTTISNYTSRGPFTGFSSYGQRYNCFVLNNLIYQIKGEANEYSLWTYDMNKDSWEKKNPLPFLPQNTFLYRYRIEGNDRNYVLSQYNNIISLWEYNEANDSWQKITDYPGIGQNDHSIFFIKDRFFMGGGRNSSQNQVFFDFWEYNFQENKWSQKNDLPYGRAQMHYVDAMCSNSTNGYIMTYYNELWKYKTQDDHWEKLTPLEVGPATRFYGTLLTRDEELYLVGGYTYEDNGVSLGDIWKYDIHANTWSLINRYNEIWFHLNWYPIPVFFYNSNIYMGWTSSYFDSAPFLIEFKNNE